MESAIQSLIKSRRFWAAMASLAVVLLRDKLPFPVSEEQITNAVLAIGAWIVGESLRSSREVVNAPAQQQ